MTELKESDVLYIARSVYEWRSIVGCIRNTAKVSEQKERDELFRIANEIESHLPSSDGAPK